MVSNGSAALQNFTLNFMLDLQCTAWRPGCFCLSGTLFIVPFLRAEPWALNDHKQSVPHCHSWQMHFEAHLPRVVYVTLQHCARELSSTTATAKAACRGPMTQPTVLSRINPRVVKFQSLTEPCKYCYPFNAINNK